MTAQAVVRVQPHLVLPQTLELRFSSTVSGTTVWHRLWMLAIEKGRLQGPTVMRGGR